MATRDGEVGVPRWEVAADIWRKIWIDEVHHSTGLGGNSLTRNEVERLLADGKAVGSRLLAEYLYVRGYGNASRWVCRQIAVVHEDEVQDEAVEPQPLVTLEEICFLHEQTARLPWVATHEYGLDAKQRDIQVERQGEILIPGRFREHELQASGEGITPVSWRFVPAEMEKWLVQANELAAIKTPAPRKAGIFIQELSEALARSHSRFVKTQPFATANGLVARLATNLLLVRKGLPPAIIQKRQRSAHQQALQRADLGDFSQLADLFAQSIFRSLAWFAQPEAEEGLVPLSALATEEINVAALRVAAARGRLKAKRPPGDRWLSTPEWVADYIADRHRRQSHSVG